MWGKPHSHADTFVTIKTSPFLTCLDFGVCAPQSASFALATTHSPNVLLNASRPYRRSPSAYFEGIHGVRFAWGNTRLSHRKVSFTHYATRSRAKKSKLARSLVLFIKFGARFLASLRLAFRLQTSVELEQFFKSVDVFFALLHVFLSEKLAQIQNQAVDFVADI